MSFQIVALVMKTRFGNSQRKCIALKLADCANDDGTKIFPAKSTIALHAECGLRTVQRTLAEWCTLNVLQLVRRGGGGPHDSSEYRFHLPMLEALADGDCEFYQMKNGQKEAAWGIRSTAKISGNKGAAETPLAIKKGAAAAKKGAAETKKGAAAAPNPIKEPINDVGEATSAPLENLFEEFCEAARRHGFANPSQAIFKTKRTAFAELIELIGVDEWREFLELAGRDRACTGRLKPSPGHDRPWRLTFSKMCDAAWVAERLDAWRSAGQDETGEPIRSVVLQRESPDWFAVKKFYEATGEDRRARLMRHMASRDSNWAVAPEILERARDYAEASHAGA